MLFTDEDNFTSFEVVIIDDTLAEGAEFLSGELAVASSVQNLSISVTIEILDNEG